MSPDHPPPLEGLYLHLVRSGFSLSVRDYRDALTALRQGYGLHHREELCWLCETLWARSDQERRRLKRLFRTFPWPEPEAALALTGRPGVAGGAPRSTGSGAGTASGTAAPAAVPEQSPTVEFAGPRETGVALPRIVGPAGGGEAFIFTPRPHIALRSLIVAWRRYRRARRAGPRTELDLDATLAEQCRRGFLPEPVLVPARRNQARLVVLVDASPSMAPWSSLNELLTESLKASQLAHTALYFFDNVPDAELFPHPGLTRPLPLAQAIRDHPECPLLIVGDGGAAKGRMNRGRLAGTRAFLQDPRRRADWHPVAWINPLPRRRWAGTTAGRIAALPDLVMAELGEDGLIQAVDYLRGKRDG